MSNTVLYSLEQYKKNKGIIVGIVLFRESC